ncbi:MAG: tRNA preQ1(34) S-adenosylmethionine ribosyltransferase-isomerase QueA [Anaerolineales bacterium]
MKTQDFDYELPRERIAQYPIEPRDAARLMVIHRKTHQIEHSHFREIGNYLSEGDLLVINDTRVIPARLYGKKSGSGGKVEVLLLKKLDSLTWECLVGGKRVRVNSRIEFMDEIHGLIIDEKSSSQRIIQFNQPIEAYLSKIGNTPLPPYIHAHLDNPQRYQTVYAQWDGSAAAPTAGMHFTQSLINSLEEKGIRFARVTLHIGLDTFAPVVEDDPQAHQIHTEWCNIPQETVDLINQTKQAKRKVIAVGTTSVRALESAAMLREDGLLDSYQGVTNLYILPGFHFKVIDAMITNFHLPRSTLLMLVSAFAGREWILEVYQLAIQMGYRFYSFGDAMLIL